ncbi:MAG: sigma-70 family RNA polymerase sigma factor [Deltaproteobacteria bacterium]|nr:sigma-70 family RNA polymerase sigma factor [Deltaproteobacteria bacterium]
MGTAVPRDGRETTRTSRDAAAALGVELERHRDVVWGLCYRMTGSAADADDIVQETFTRAIATPPRRTDEPWRPWLVRVACNLARDHLRRRRRRAYVGPWLPEPIETDAEPPSFEPGGAPLLGNAEARYAELESVSFAFLLALEALTPSQRAVLLLRDVFDYSVRETAGALAMSEANVKTTHLRARRAMDAYDAAPSRPSRELAARTKGALEKLLLGLLLQDTSAVEATLASEVRALSDGGGEVYAALKPILGRDRVTRFLLGLARRRSVRSSEIRIVNGLPAMVARFADERAGEADTMVFRVDVAPDGGIRAIHTVLTSRKLAAIASI